MKREKLFGDGRRRPMDRNQKTRLLTLARVLMRRTSPGRHYGQLTAKCIAVLHALLFGFHNAASGRCDPSLDRIADAAGCARSTAHEALKALERVGLVVWHHRLRRIRDAAQLRVVRTSNAYRFPDPATVMLPKSSKSDCRTGTGSQYKKQTGQAVKRAVAAAVETIADVSMMDIMPGEPPKLAFSPRLRALMGG